MTTQEKETAEKAKKEFDKKINGLKKQIETTQTTNMYLTIKKLGDLAILMAQDADNLLAGLCSLGDDYEVLSLSVNGNCHAFLRKK